MNNELLPAVTPPAVEVPALYRTAYERLAVELALHMESAESIFAEHHYTTEQAQELLEQPAFIALLKKVEVECRESGLSYRHKARAIAEELLPTAMGLAIDPMVSSAVRADVCKWFAKVGALEPKESKDEGKNSGGLTLQITFSGNAPQTIVSNREPLTIEQE